MEIPSTPPKDTFFPKILFIVCCSLVVVGGAFIICNYVLPKKEFTVVTVVSSTPNEVPIEVVAEENIAEPVPTITLSDDMCAFRDTDMVFLKDTQIVACQKSGKLVLLDVFLNKEQMLIVEESFDVRYKYLLTIFENKSDGLAMYKPVMSYFYDAIEGKFTLIENKEINLARGDCSAYNYTYQKIYKWFCGDEGASTNSGVPVGVLDIQTGEVKVLITPEDLGLNNNNWTHSRVWFDGELLSATETLDGTRLGDKIIVYDLYSRSLEPTIFIQQE